MTKNQMVIRMRNSYQTESEQHNFLILLGDALRLLEDGRQKTVGQTTYARSIVILAVASVEAAINSAIYSACDNTEEYSVKMRQNSVLDKAKAFLKEHEPAGRFDKGSRESQKFDSAAQLRNSMVHPNAVRFEVTVEYSPESESQKFGTFEQISSNLAPISKRDQLVVLSRSLKLSEAEQVLKDCVGFFNYFNHCWGIDSQTAQAVYIDWFHGARKSTGAAYETESLELVRKNNHWLNLEFL